MSYIFIHNISDDNKERIFKRVYKRLYKDCEYYNLNIDEEIYLYNNLIDIIKNNRQLLKLFLLRKDSKAGREYFKVLTGKDVEFRFSNKINLVIDEFYKEYDEMMKIYKNNINDKKIETINIIDEDIMNFKDYYTPDVKNLKLERDDLHEEFNAKLIGENTELLQEADDDLFGGGSDDSSSDSGSDLGGDDAGGGGDLFGGGSDGGSGDLGGGGGDLFGGGGDMGGGSGGKAGSEDGSQESFLDEPQQDEDFSNGTKNPDDPSETDEASPEVSVDFNKALEEGKNVLSKLKRKNTIADGAIMYNTIKKLSKGEVLEKVDLDNINSPNSAFRLLWLMMHNNSSKDRSYIVNKVKDIYAKDYNAKKQTTALKASEMEKDLDNMVALSKNQ